MLYEFVVLSLSSEPSPLEVYELKLPQSVMQLGQIVLGIAQERVVASNLHS
jgi:hypothetical protein